MSASLRIYFLHMCVCISLFSFLSGTTSVPAIELKEATPEVCLRVAFFQQFADFLFHYKNKKDAFYLPDVALQHLSGAKQVIEKLFSNKVEKFDHEVAADIASSSRLPPAVGVPPWYAELRKKTSNAFVRRCFETGTVSAFCSTIVRRTVQYVGNFA